MKESEKTVSFLRFFSNPIVGILGSLASIVGLILAVYFYFESAQRRELTYLINPAKAIVVKANQTSRLSVTLDGKSINSDLTAAQIAFWNAGREAIRNEHVLRPFVVHTGGGAPIIEATIRKKSRDIISIGLDTSRIGLGELGVSWNILEQNDGGVLQIIFAGVPETPISVTAAVEGQSKVKRLNIADKESSFWYRRAPDWVTMTLGWSCVVSGVILFFLFLREALRTHAGGERLEKQAILIATIPLVMVAMGILVMIVYLEPRPPFGF